MFNERECPINPSAKNENSLLFFPVDIVNESAFISPEEIIKSAIREYRSSDKSDRELSEYICELLSYIMDKNRLVISQRNIKDNDFFDRFRILKFEKLKI
jgi:hypothetical protein